MPAQNEFPMVVEQLKKILKPYAKNLTVKADTPDSYYLDGPYSKTWQEEDIGKVVLFYGAGEADFTKVKAEILGHYSDTDEWEDIKGVNSMEADMRAAGLSPMLYIYPHLPHWFFEDDRPEFHPEAAELAWQRTLEFLGKQSVAAR